MSRNSAYSKRYSPVLWLYIHLTAPQSYADPLRKYARSKDTAIIHAYEAKTLFGNIDQLLPVNEEFLADLERMLGSQSYALGVGDVALKHVSVVHSRATPASDARKSSKKRKHLSATVTISQSVKTPNASLSKKYPKSRARALQDILMCIIRFAPSGEV